MDVNGWTIALDSMLILILTVTGIVYGQMDTESVSMEDNQDGGNELQLSARNAPSYTTFDPYFDWLNREVENDKDRTLVNLLKRSGIQLSSDSYNRFPRIKERRIIPFYSYDQVQSKYQPRPRYLSRYRVALPYTPWNWPVFNSNRYFKGNPVYASYRK